MGYSKHGDLPALDPHALQNLTDKIQDKLKMSTSAVTKDDQVRQKTTSSHKPSRKAERPKQKANVVKKELREASKKQVSVDGPKHSNQKRTKDLRHGHAKTNGVTPAEVSQNTVKAAVPAYDRLDDHEDPELDREVAALGGTRDDLRLMGAADSESEIEGEVTGKANRIGRTSTQDVLEMVRQLGLDKISAQRIDESEEEVLDEQELEDPEHGYKKHHDDTSYKSDDIGLSPAKAADAGKRRLVWLLQRG